MSEWLLHTFVKNYDQTSDPKVRTNIGSFAGYVGIACNTLLCIAKMIIGALAGSISIVADAVNNLSDAASNIVSLLSFKLAARPADKDHPYGHGRLEYLSGLIVAALVILVGFELLKSSIEKAINPEPIEFSWVLVIVLVLAILVKLWMAVFNKKMGTLINSQTLIATSIDSRNDVISTSAVLLASLIFHFTGINLDAWIGIAVALFILWSGVALIRETIAPLLGQAPDPELVKHIAEKTESYDGVLGIHDLIVHDYGPGRIFASIHAEVAAEVDVLESHELIDAIEADFRNNDDLEVVIHMDPIVTNDPMVAETRTWLKSEIRAKIDERIDIHDLRMVPGENQTNVIFDAVLPYDSPLSPEQLKERIQELVTAYNPTYQCVILVDRDLVGRHA